jgi:hypothetical protein
VHDITQPSVERQACVAAIFRASDVESFVSSTVTFPRPVGLLADRLEQSRRPDAPIPCDQCGIAVCSTRSLLGSRRPNVVAS